MKLALWFRPSRACKRCDGKLVLEKVAMAPSPEEIQIIIDWHRERADRAAGLGDGPEWERHRNAAQRWRWELPKPKDHCEHGLPRQYCTALHKD